MQSRKIEVAPLPQWTRVLDWLLWPVMHIVTGTFFVRGRPQETHHWHVQTLSIDETKLLHPAQMQHIAGDPNARRRHLFKFIPLVHLPIFGGWKQFVVLRPEEPGCWHVGWLTGDSAAVHRYELTTPVRMLVGPQAVQFFALCSVTGEQLLLTQVGSGRLWGPRFRTLRLL